MGGTVVMDRDRGYRQVRRSIVKQFQNLEIDVEIFVEGNPLEIGTVAHYAAINEYGSADGHVPERSFIRAGVTEHKAKYLEAMRQACRRSASTGAPIAPVLDAIGSHLVGSLQARIAAGIPPANAPSTIRAKGSSTPLIDTGALRQSIKHEVKTRRRGRGPL